MFGHHFGHRVARAVSTVSIAAGCLGAMVLACASDDDPTGQNTGDGGSGDGSVGIEVRPTNKTCLAPARPPSAAPVGLQRVFENVAISSDPDTFHKGPLIMAQPPGDNSRWFLGRRHGEIISFPSSKAVDPTPFTPPVVVDLATLTGMPVLTDDEQGFHGMTFSPRFAENGRLYVSFITTGPGGDSPYATEIGYLTSTDGGQTFGTYTSVLHYGRPTQEHNGGSVAFSKDGYLFISTGEGTDDSNSQFTSNLLGKVLRIDVDNPPPPGKTYGIPADNPFMDSENPEIYALGLRNPYRLTVDRTTGDVWVGDVGGELWEEVNRVEIGGNYGWPCREGAHDKPVGEDKCPSRSGLIDPVFEYAHEGSDPSRSITGGFVYRGSAISGFEGTYIFGDFISKQMFGLTFDGAAWSSTQLNPDGPADGYASFAEDNDGELYAIALVDNVIYKLVPKAAAQPSTFPELLSKTGCVDPKDATKPAEGLIPYGVNAALWSDGAEKGRWMALPDGKTITVGADGDFDLPVGSVLMKSFSVFGKRIETRLLVHHEDGDWAGYSYEWNDAQTDAVLLPSGKSKAVGAQTWTYPSRTDCLRCHTKGAGRTLGLEVGQLNGDFPYPGTGAANQLRTLEHIGAFAAPVGEPAQLASYPQPSGQAPVADRARAYLHANCSGCHRPNGGAGRATMDLRFATPFKDTATCNAAPQIDDFGSTETRLIVPGSPEKSILDLRVHATDVKRMPPLARTIVDPAGSALIDEWIKGTTSCP